ncbi:hypothetical protein PV327_010591 [Microctonus hyperodae]|uniref:Uncharacterized protein n=1 Tax=Microctonus hyperodae TaxID=165561 RepID=A0AA39FS79_MICHY|nr:hypothetical protein PV327_010591 [Microctonus hyperodae]
MSGICSSTGLIAARIQPIYKVKPKKIELSGTSKPAPFILRPFAGLFNPYPYGCSVFCNHPADYEAKEFVRRAKESWATEGKALLLPVEMEMIRATLLASGIADTSGINDSAGGYDINPITNVPDELFRKYTETDSRPLTPTPTLVSGTVTIHRDDFVNFNATCNPKERTTLILDLRTASQEQDIDTLNWHAVTLEPPPSPVRKINQISKSHSSLSSNHHYPHRQQQSQRINSGSQENAADVNENISKSDDNHENDENINDDMVMIKRRGKRLKKRKCRRGSNYGQQCEVRDPLEPPETQVSQVNDGSRKNSALTPLDNITTVITPDEQSLVSVQQQQSPASSFISPEILKHVIRDLDNEMIEQEFFLRKKIVMIEALRVKSELQLQNRPSSRQSFNQLQLAVNVPRIFSRQNARFELLDSATLATMKSLDYLGKCVFLAPGRKLMFARTFSKYYEDTMDGVRYISSNDLMEAIDEVMGKPLTHEQLTEFNKFIGKINVPLNFRTWCGVCAACERLLSSLSPRKLDMPTWIEQTDFQALERRLQFIKVDEKLHYLLTQIRDR